MGIFRSLVNFYLYSNLHIAICCLAIVIFTQVAMNANLDVAYISFIFSGTLCLYAIHRLIGIRTLPTESITSRFEVIMKYNLHITVYAAAAGVMTLLYFYKLDVTQKYLSIIPILLSAAYVLPILPGGKRLRDVPLIKIFLIAICWSLFTCIIPLWGTVQPALLAILAIERALFLLAITIPFDIRDQEIDNRQGVKTIATSLGKHTSQLIAYYAFFIAASILLWSKYNSLITGFYFFPLVVTYIIGVLLVSKTSQSRSDFYFTGWVDGLLIIPIIVASLLKSFS